MSHFAQVKNNIVVNVIKCEKDIIDSGILGDPKEWIQTSYNTRNNIHYGQDGKPDGGIALRGNFAGIGSIYDSENDVFYLAKPFPSHILDKNLWGWREPIDLPFDKLLPNDLPENSSDRFWNEELLTFQIIIDSLDFSSPKIIYTWNVETQNWDKN